ncbi:Non-structural maintenance of chromosomes element 4 A [Phialemonium atrogriseum]|uniref:Non-structural maintenance of chromosomes element 4 n=1 Tax=Phialemonium atrogriseum TaxID=1093897 RepID=A0AAJ0C403_9PEZI|nr:Non-structural maintenance of chromosomes element 4 A [Phialemonium atrogriseum]KAK1768693.1 Non-structural maintenance of chromosomes element 4 A [Phialemonium atrogriseum]
MADDDSVATSPTPSPSELSENENQRTLAVRNKGKAAAGRPKRKRGNDIGGEPSTSRRRTREPSDDEDEEESEEEKAFDPDQPMEERRRIQRGLRDLQRDLQENPDEYLQADPKALLDYFEKSEQLLEGVKQTSEAAIDSRGLLIAADLSARRVQRLTSGNVLNGIDVDEFVSKCITYMLQGRGIGDDNAPELSSTQRQRRQPNRGALGSDDEDGIGDDGDMLNWEHLGRYAAIPSVRRPAVPGFLLGPLSVEKKTRKVTQRMPLLKINSLKEVRPEVLNAEDLAKSEKNDLTAICRKIRKRLQTVQEEAQDAVEDAVDDDMTEEETRKLMDQHSLRDTGGVDLMRFVVNPHSFGQTVENMFYVSFLIRDGYVKVDFDKNGLPALEYIEKDESEAGNPRHGAMRHQAVMSIDMTTWRDIVDAFDIREPMIEHRREHTESGPGARGWYS